MKKLFIILGNGFTIDFINQLERNNIDVTDLFKLGHHLKDFDNKYALLSYKCCPALWTLGVRPNQSIEEHVSLINDVITCVNVFFDFVHHSERNRRILDESSSIYIKAYAELIFYLKKIFTYYNSLVTNEDIIEYLCTKGLNVWGWARFLSSKKLEDFESVTFITYNYDIWLERILDCLGVQYNIYGFNTNRNCKINVIKPHGSISFVKKGDRNEYVNISDIKITRMITFNECGLNEFHLASDELDCYNMSAMIPPSGDSSRQQCSWATLLRSEAENQASKVSQNDDVIICGLSYCHVDRHELDKLLINFNPNVNLMLINPTPPKELNAVLCSLFKNYVLQTSSDHIEGILND